MNKRITKILNKVTEEILEKLAFIFSFPEEDRDESENDEIVTGSVVFKGLFNGMLFMKISSRVLPELAGNMLGIDEEETTKEIQIDAFKELINVVCGNLLPAIAGKEIIFNVNAPIVYQSGSEPKRDDEPVAIAKLDLEDRICDLMLFIDGILPPEIAESESD